MVTGQDSLYAPMGEKIKQSNVFLSQRFASQCLFLSNPVVSNTQFKKNKFRNEDAPS
jgi:hypothetical protein